MLCSLFYVQRKLNVLFSLKDEIFIYLQLSVPNNVSQRNVIYDLVALVDYLLFNREQQNKISA